MPYKSSILFKIKDIHSGWIDGYIREDKKNVEFSYSYMTDFLGDLLEEVLCVLDNKKEFDDIYAALHKSKVEVGNHSYHCISVNNKFAFVPKADTFLAGNSAIPNVTAVVEETETDYKVDLEFSALPFARIFSTIFAIFAAVIGVASITSEPLI